ncbi:uncharacterized protein LOC119556763 [Drosophila subpulchrella]|uniref:uncharacterized protein LOC119556763 n=1 Tax=Drosophila subpulchrella TaxID=1486046 RepID=UPI0018A19524|nr:uncharacterized protein LOC119556763 [Drosophila subpulchrella]
MDEDKRSSDGGEPKPLRPELMPLEAAIPRPRPSLSQANWKQVQREIDLKVAVAMKDFYNIHSQALLRVERTIEKDLLPKLESNATGDLKEIADLVRQLLIRVENLRPVFRLQLDEETAKQAVVDKPLQATSGVPVASPSPNADEKPESEGTTTATADVIFRNTRYTGQTVSERELPVVKERRRRRKTQVRDDGAQISETEERRLYKERERAQFEVNLVLLKKSLFSLHLNRNNRYWPHNRRSSREPKGPIHRPIDLASF